MAQYSYPGNQNNRYDPPSGNQGRRKYQSCAPSRGGKSKRLEWVIFWLFAFDVFCQIMGAMAGVIFWWLSLGDSVVVLAFLILLIVARK